MEELVNEMLEKTKKTRERYDELTALVSDPKVIADNKEWQKLAKERSKIEDVANAYDKLEKLNKDYLQCKNDHASEKDHEMKQMFFEELERLKKEIEDELENLKELLLPKDENDDNNVIIEIRQAAGGEESALFCYVLYRMYSMYAESKRWKVEVLDLNETELGGIKEITFMVKG